VRSDSFDRYRPTSASLDPTKIRARIGVLVDDLLDPYQAGLLQAARDAALARGASLWCFVGGELSGSHPGDLERNKLYDFVNRENVSALAIMMGPVGNAIGLEGLGRFCQRFKDIPLCAIGGELPGIPSVQVSNASGVREAVRHLVVAHNHRRIAFVCGRPKNHEAEERYNAYVAALAEHGIALDERLVAPGEFSQESGAAAVATFLDERRLTGEIDAIVTADDVTAFGALQELARRKIDVPEQIAVVGFDDVEPARFCSPPLTTVRQPLREMGEATVRTLLKKVDGEEIALRTMVPTKLIVRRSCGCFGGDTVGVEGKEGAPRGTSSFQVEMLKRRETIKAELLRAALGTFIAVPGWETLLVNSFIDQLDNHAGRFSAAFRSVLRNLVEAGADLVPVHDVITVMRAQLLACLEQNPVLRARAEDMFQQVRIIASEAIERRQADRRTEAETLTSSLIQTSRLLTTLSTVDELKTVLRGRLGELGITFCYLSLFRAGPQPGGTAVPLLASDPALKWEPTEDEPFPSDRLVPQQALQVDKSRAFVVMPLYFEKTQLGILAMAFDLRTCNLYDILADLVGAALYRLRGELAPLTGDRP
jgi:DNA-binding LacI/PurR family transcriptional regulator